MTITEADISALRATLEVAPDLTPFGKDVLRLLDAHEQMRARVVELEREKLAGWVAGYADAIPNLLAQARREALLSCAALADEAYRIGGSPAALADRIRKLAGEP